MIVTLTYIIAVADLTHIVAGSAEVSYAAMVGALDWRAYILDFMTPTLIGNLLGGVSLVTLLNHAQVQASCENGLHAHGRRGPACAGIAWRALRDSNPCFRRERATS